MSEGKPFVGGMIYRRITEIWKKSGVRMDLRMTATNIQKWIVMVCHQKRSRGHRSMEMHFVWQCATPTKQPKKFYLREDITEVAARATMIIAQCTRGATPPLGKTVTSFETSTQSQADLQPVTTPGAAQPTPPLGKTPTSFETITQSQADLQPVTQLEDRAPSDTSETQLTRSLSEKEKTVISNIFADVISSNTKVTLPEIQAGIRDSIPLRSLLLVPGMDQKVADRVRHCQSTIPRSLPEATQEKEELIEAWQEKNSIVSLDTVSFLSGMEYR